MKAQEAIEILKGMQSPLQDYADMVGAPAWASGCRYVYPEPEDYAIEEAITALEEKQNRRWVPVSERVPEETEYIGLSNGQSYMKRLEIAYMTDTIEYAFGYYDGHKWMDKRHEKIINAVAWKRHEPYKPE